MDVGSAARDVNPTTEYLKACLQSPTTPGTLCALLLSGDTAALRQCLETPVTPSLPLPPDAARQLVALEPWLRGQLVPDTQQQEWSCRLQRPDFLFWVNNALLLKGEERAAAGDLNIAVNELATKTTEAWAAGLLPNVPRPCMLAYAAAGPLLPFFCIRPMQHGGGSGGGSGSRSRSSAQVQPISGVLDLATVQGRLAALTAAFNIWRLLDDYAASGAPAPPMAMGQTLMSDGCRLTLLQGFIRKAIPGFRESHEQYTSFELLQQLYASLGKPGHQHAIIKAAEPPRLDADGTYVVHLVPVGVPCAGPPGSEDGLAAAVAGVLRGLAALHAEGFVHRDVRWPNVIFLPQDARWLLIDLEHAGREGCDCSQHPFPLRYWSSRTLLPDGRYRAASDLRMVAEQLMAGLPFELSAAGADLRQRLLQAGEVSSSSSSSSLTAEEALAHAWLSGHARS
ncbi:hypothetical protein HXX76_008744 [Chlamydomonas incerta]|uniref:Protein kinase domain-containing protein n=1 Tax=Chlamydomonas incerta TaxID=51695 RepID=A0A835VXJ7_CHLIN|nr:hypothetical protein HXX76_008744 [Chlamydomonas incerta]|eukprot:KAG2433017.1 hypothetical protein HXX76_008744 [Chlamydomonas incerta]